MAIGALIAIPPLIFTFLASKQIITGLTAGAVKDDRVSDLLAARLDGSFTAASVDLGVAWHGRLMVLAWGVLIHSAFWSRAISR